MLRRQGELLTPPHPPTSTSLAAHAAHTLPIRGDDPPTHVFTHVPTHVFTHVPTHVFTHVPTHVCTHVPIHVPTHLRTRTCVLTYQGGDALRQGGQRGRCAVARRRSPNPSPDPPSDPYPNPIKLALTLTLTRHGGVGYVPLRFHGQSFLLHQVYLLWLYLLWLH